MTDGYTTRLQAEHMQVTRPRPFYDRNSSERARCTGNAPWPFVSVHRALAPLSSRLLTTQRACLVPVGSNWTQQHFARVVSNWKLYRWIINGSFLLLLIFFIDFFIFFKQVVLLTIFVRDRVDFHLTDSCLWGKTEKSRHWCKPQSFMSAEKEREGGGEGERERTWERLIDWLIELYFSTVKILAQRPTHISAVATVILITKIFTVKYYDRRQHQYKHSINNKNKNKRKKKKKKNFFFFTLLHYS